ncbi:small ribosomal subunit protein uS3m isoform X2 [Macrobrachium rosenbergii]|uniref:small ribosomal subunit protein uS3m isoform X2 n=1 Tax=Macrobrachium rosenbergii TaxID=79674 RepID=UPI0034D69D71
MYSQTFCTLRIQNYGQLFRSFPVRSLHTSSVAFKVQSGRYKVTRDQSRPLTYEMANQPCMIGHRKSWNSWNTTSLYEGLREPETAVEDMFIRKFMTGTWHDLFVSEVHSSQTCFCDPPSQVLLHFYLQSAEDKHNKSPLAQMALSYSTLAQVVSHILSGTFLSDTPHT